MSPKTYFVGLLAVLAISIGFTFLHASHVSVPQNLGAGDLVQPYPSIWSGGIQIGTNAPVINNVWQGSCAPTITGGTSIAATSTAPFKCAIPNIPAGATAFVSITNPAAAWGEFEATDASTTAGVLNFYIYNGTGVATSSSQATSSVRYLIVN